MVKDIATSLDDIPGSLVTLNRKFPDAYITLNKIMLSLKWVKQWAKKNIARTWGVLLPCHILPPTLLCYSLKRGKLWHETEDFFAYKLLNTAKEEEKVRNYSFKLCVHSISNVDLLLLASHIGKMVELKFVRSGIQLPQK